MAYSQNCSNLGEEESKMRSEYSEKELAMFEWFGYADLTNNLTPVVLYRLCVEKAFTNDLRGPYVNSLRRCAIALRDCTCYRMTPEWDKMIYSPGDELFEGEKLDVKGYVSPIVPGIDPEYDHDYPLADDEDEQDEDDYVPF